MKSVAFLLALACATPAAAQDVSIADRDVFPESLSADKAGRLYIGSIKGIVFRTAPDGDVAEPWIRPDAENGLLGLLGVLVDEASGSLWACSSPVPFRNPPALGDTALLAFDLASGKFKARYPFPGSGGACNDVAIAADGTAFATDTPNGRILTLAPGARALAVFAEDAAMKGIDGIAFAEDGTLYINNVITGAMQRVERDPAGAYKGLVQIKLPEPLKGPDGLRPIGGHRFLQAEGGSGRITEVTIAGDVATIRVLREGLLSSPGVTPARGRAYATEGKITYFFDPALKGKDPNPFLVRAIPLDPK